MEGGLRVRVVFLYITKSSYITKHVPTSLVNNIVHCSVCEISFNRPSDLKQHKVTTYVIKVRYSGMDLDSRHKYNVLGSKLVRK